MGGGKKKKHESFKIDPAFLGAALKQSAILTAPPNTDLPLGFTQIETPLLTPPTSELDSTPTEPQLTSTGDDVDPADPDLDPAAEIVAHTFTQQQFPDPETEPAAWHQALTQAIEDTNAALLIAGQDPNDPAIRKVVADAAGDQLRELTPDQLAAVSAAAGFDHPHLVGLNSPTNPLTYWANPAYPMDHKSKLAIQAAAQARYEELEQGYTVAGMTLEDLKAKEAKLGTTTADPIASFDKVAPWTATTEEIKALKAHAEATISDPNFPGFNGSWGEARFITTPEQAYAVLDAHNRIAAATGATQQDQIQKETILQQLVPTIPRSLSNLTQDERNAIIAKMGGDVTAAQYLSPDRQAGLVAHGHNIAAATVAETNQKWVSTLTDTYEQAQAADLIGVNGATVAADLSDHAEAAQKLAILGSINALPRWSSGAAPPDSEAPIWNQTLPGSSLTLKETKEELGVPYSGYQAQQKAQANAAAMVDVLREHDLPTLRAVAAHAGLENADSATRTHLQQYLAGTAEGHWKPSDIQAKVTAHQAKKEHTKAKKAANKDLADKYADTPSSRLANLAASVKKKPGVPNMSPPPPGSFSERIALIAATATHKNASLAAVPPVTTQTVDTSEFTEIPDMHLGGTNRKKYFVDQNGQKWMLKVDPGNGYRAHMESAAAAATQLAGIPTAPVVATRKAGNTLGSLQPLVHNTGTMNSNPKSHTQQDVDSIVGAHVASWVVGNHDGHSGNMLRTEGGGVVTIDNGQAFKFAGKDKLDTDFNPSSTQVWNSIYKAAQTGALAPGVHVRPEAAALPVIASFERIPDSQWRDIFRPAADLGAKGDNAAWKPEMVKRAAKQHSIPASEVSAEQTAEAFLDYVTERKHNLRAEFMKFFVREGWDVKTSFTATAQTGH